MKSKFSDRLKHILTALLSSLRNNWGRKLTALAFAIIIWAFVLISANPTREHRLVDVPVNIIGEEEMYESGQITTASLEDYEQLVDISLSVSISELYNLNLSDVELWVDISSIRNAGDHELVIESNTSVGEIINIFPTSITISTDDIKHRKIAVELNVEGEIDEALYTPGIEYSPMTVEIEGPSDLMDSIDKVYGSIDISGRTESFADVIKLSLIDSDGNELDIQAFNVSEEELTVWMDIGETKTVNLDLTDSIIGQDSLQDGYILTDIKAYPDTIRIAGSKSDLDLVDSLKLKAISISGEDGDVVMETSVLLPDRITLLDDANVQLALFISLEEKSITYEDHLIYVRNLTDGLNVAELELIQITATGPVAQIDSLSQSYIKLFVDVEGLEPGQHSLPVQYEINDKYTDVVVNMGTTFVTVVIS